MTREEKIQQALDKLTREEKLDRIRDDIYNWDHDTLYETAVDTVMGNLSPLSDSDLSDEYYEWFSYEFEDSEYDDDEPEEYNVSEPQQETCTCESRDLLWYGCTCGYKGT